MAIVSIKWAGLKDPNKQPSFQDATGAAPVVPTPTFTSATTSSYTVAITGYDAQFTYTVSASVGSAVRTGGNVTVSGLSGNQSSTLTVTAANTARELSFSASQAFLSLPATPTLSQTGQTTSSVTVTIGNYDAGLTYTVGSSAGSATRSGNAITVTGLSEGQAITVTATASNASGNSTQGSITATSAQIIVTGGTVTTPGDGYKYHTFTSSGNLVVSGGSKQMQYLVIGGGGGTGGAGSTASNTTWGGAGGAGGVVSSNQSFSSGTYPIVVGAGGTYLSNGSDSSLGNIVASGGGVGGGGSAGTSGGCGGGAGGRSSKNLGVFTGYSGGSGNQGGSGANTNEVTGNVSIYAGGGGGGGGNGSQANGGAAVNIFGVSRAGGGAARWDNVFGTATGGGGTINSSDSIPNSGAVNTGGGSGGVTIPSYNNLASGGSGIVIVRYTI